MNTPNNKNNRYIWYYILMKNLAILFIFINMVTIIFINLYTYIYFNISNIKIKIPFFIELDIFLLLLIFKKNQISSYVTPTKWLDVSRNLSPIYYIANIFVTYLIFTLNIIKLKFRITIYFLFSGFFLF